MGRSLLFVLVVIGLAGIASWATAHEGDHARNPSRYAVTFAKPIETAHGYEKWHEQQAISYDIKIHFGGALLFEGTTIFEIGAERVRMTSKDGKLVMVWDGKDAWYTPINGEWKGPRPRFHLRTWTYFLAAPFKLRDPGSQLKPMPAGGIHENETAMYKRAKLTFGKDVGDAPDDWYVAYKDWQNRLAGLAYIVTYGNDVDEANKKPGCILYRDYTDVDGVALSTKWIFHHWSKEAGAHGKPKGHVEIGNLQFIKLEPGTFDKPDGAKLDPLPEE